MNRSELVNTLELIKPALAKDNLIPVNQCFNFTKGRISAYDGSIAIIGPTECADTFAVHGGTFLGLLSNSKAEAVEINLEKTDAIIKMGKAQVQMPFTPEEDFIFTEPKVKGETTVISISLIEAMKLCLNTVSTDETQAALQGLTLMQGKVYSCNSDMLTRVQLKNSPKNRMMLPTAFCHAIIKIWSSLSMTKGTLTASDEWLVAEFSEWSVWSRVPDINDTPLDFEDLIKKTIKAKVALQDRPSTLFDALARARVLADPESQKTDVTIAKGKLRLSTSTHMGEVDDTISLSGHPDIKCSINASHLAQAIEHCDKIAFHENCVVLEMQPDVLMLVSNM